MEFGKVEDISGIDFTLPPDHPQTTQLLNGMHLQHAEAPRAEVRVGGIGWVCRDWVGSVYPPQTKDNKHLHAYGQQFSTIELNTTHYRTPDAATIDKWKADVPPHFKFCPKLLQTVSHQLRLANARGLTEDFCGAVSGLGENLGSVFVQLPPNFGLREAPQLVRFLEDFPKGVRLAVEFRHADWFKPNDLADDVFAEMQKLGIATVISDVAGRRDVVHMRLTAKRVYIRFMGNNLHATDYTRINDWSFRMLQWLDCGLESVDFWVHQPNNSDSPPVMQHAIRQFNEICGLSLKNLVLYQKSAQTSLF